MSGAEPTGDAAAAWFRQAREAQATLDQAIAELCSLDEVAAAYAQLVLVLMRGNTRVAARQLGVAEESLRHYMKGAADQKDSTSL